MASLPTSWRSAPDGELEQLGPDEPEGDAELEGEPGDALRVSPSLEVVCEVTVGERAERSRLRARAVAICGIGGRDAHVRIPHSVEARRILRHDHPAL